MTRERFSVIPAVCGPVERDGELLMVRRAGSGYRDRQLSLPAGHHGGGEDAELQQGDVVVLESPDAACGEIGSCNSLDMHIKGAAAVVTSGGVRDRDECIAQGVQIKPGAVVGDGDGVVAVPREHAELVAEYARQENENHEKGRAALYGELGWELDESTR